MADGVPMCVLVVDEDVDFSVLLVDELVEHGLDGVAVRSGRDALRRLRHERYHALITALRMPDVGGLELLRVSRLLDPSRPVIVTTSQGGIVTALESARLGAYHYLAKPFRMSTLMEAVRASLGLHAAAAEQVLPSAAR